MNTEPETIITDQQKSVIVALENIKKENRWDGNHLFDSFHIVKNLKKNTKNEKLVEKLRQAMFTHSLSSYYKFIN